MVNNCDDARKSQTNQPAINKNIFLPHTILFPEAASHFPHLPYNKPLCLYSARYNGHQKLGQWQKEVLKEINEGFAI